MGYENVKTYIQSGNVIFTAANDAPTSTIAARIEKLILTQFGFEVPVVVLSKEELDQTVTNNPFAADKENFENLHVTFLKEIPAEQSLKNIQELKFPPDQFQIMGKCVFLNIPGAYHKTKLSNAFFEKKLDISLTTRNWKTVLKLAELSQF